MKAQKRSHSFFVSFRCLFFFFFISYWGSVELKIYIFKVFTIGIFRKYKFSWKSDLGRIWFSFFGFSSLYKCFMVFINVIRRLYYVMQFVVLIFLSSKLGSICIFWQVVTILEIIQKLCNYYVKLFCVFEWVHIAFLVSTRKTLKGPVPKKLPAC